MKTNIILRFLAIVTLVAGFAACQKNPSAPRIAQGRKRKPTIPHF